MILECIDNVLSHFYRPQTKLRKGNVFTPVSYSVHRAGVSASVHAGIHTPQQTPPRADPPQQTATAADGTHPTGMLSCLDK